MRLNNILLSLITSLIVLNINAQVKDPVAKDLIDKMAAKAKAYPSIVADFSFTFENLAEDIEDSYEGKAWIKDNMYKVNLMGQIVFCDGTTIWTVLEDVGEVSVTTRDLTDQSFMNNPSKLFDSYEEDYKFKYFGLVDMDGKKVHKIELYPNEPEQGLEPGEFNSDLSKIQLFITEKGNDLYAAKYFSQGGTSYTIKLKSLDSGKTLSAPTFTFNPADFPDFEVIDLRE